MTNAGSPRPLRTQPPTTDISPVADPVRSPLAGGIRLFEFRGITVFLHFSWIIVAFIEIESRRDHYTSMYWNALEYVTIFVIVLLHEFGHSFACRSVGGRADRIMLWPLGGVAIVDPPERPGAWLWSIVAGPLVNVVLFLPLYFLNRATGSMPANVGQYVSAVYNINRILLIFNLLPLYPLDGGKIIQSLLWFVVGQSWSLLISASIGVIGAALFVLVAVWGYLHQIGGAIWFGALGLFAAFNCWNALKYALALRRIARIPRHTDLACPACAASPPALPIWKCPRCETAMDIFASAGACPNCGNRAAAIPCVSCGKSTPLQAWQRSAQTIGATMTSSPAFADPRTGP